MGKYKLVKKKEVDPVSPFQTKSCPGVNTTMQIVLKGRKIRRLLVNQFELQANGMKLILHVDQYTGHLRIMEHGNLGNRLVVLPEVANIIKIGTTRC